MAYNVPITLAVIYGLIALANAAVAQTLAEPQRIEGKEHWRSPRF
jgi:hypothetical protein